MSDEKVMRARKKGVVGGWVGEGLAKYNKRTHCARDCVCARLYTRCAKSHMRACTRTLPVNVVSRRRHDERRRQPRGVAPVRMRVFVVLQLNRPAQVRAANAVHDIHNYVVWEQQVRHGRSHVDDVATAEEDGWKR